MVEPESNVLNSTSVAISHKTSKEDYLHEGIRKEIALFGKTRDSGDRNG